LTNKIKAFLIYAYGFIFLYMLNSFALIGMLKLKVPKELGFIFEVLTMTAGLFFLFRYLVNRYYRIKDDKLILKAWLFHFVPFVFLSAVFLLSIVTFVKYPPFAVFVYLNGDVLILFLTFKFAVDKFIEGKNV